MFMESWILRVSKPALTLQETRSIHDSMNIPKFEFFANTKNIFIIYERQTLLYLIWIRINGFVRVLNGKAEQPAWTRTANVANKRLVLYVRLGCGSMSVTTPVSLLANEHDVRIVLHGQVSLAAVNHIYIIYEAMNGCKRSIKGLLRKCKY